MKMRKITFILAISIFLFACYILYTSLDASTSRRRMVYERGREDIEELERRVKILQEDIVKNGHIINDIRMRINSIIGPSDIKAPISSIDQLISFTKESQPVKQVDIDFLNLGAGVRLDNEKLCKFSTQKSSSVDVQMLDVYDLLKFDNPDGGAWKQGWNITYDTNVVENKSPQLQVIVIPHSHCDPGWIKTFERYYQDQTRFILDSMLTKLLAEKRMSFIFAEISFFERWWRDLDNSRREKLKSLLKNGQFEIVTGAWVMTDEANSHYFSIIDQLIEGNQWLENHLDYKPKNHWSIDPFGLSATLPYVLGLSNFSNMAIQRVHYSVKKYLAETKQLEFIWRQLWDSDSKSDIFCHVFPFYSYDIPHTCGPDPKICCQFDFRRLPGSGLGCPWNVPPVPIRSANVEERSSLLLDQYRKKAQLYKSNVLLIPLGDDFRYESVEEFDHQFENYQRLFDYMNNRKEWNVKARFGTLNDYFTTLHEHFGKSDGQKSNLPTLSGDFFTYADRDDHYWSGYYTSRPFYKRMDRVLQHYLRAAEISFSVAMRLAKKFKAKGYLINKLFPFLVAARRNLGLFQHHDGITGTAKDHVVVDYGTRMLHSIQDCRTVIADSLRFSLYTDKSSYQSKLKPTPFEFTDRIVQQDMIPEKMVISLTKQPRNIIVYNSLTVARNEIVCIHSASSNVEVKSTMTDELVDHQINPVVFKDRTRVEISSTVFEICWPAKIPALSVARYTISIGDDSASKKNNAALFSNFQHQEGAFEVKKFDEKEEYFTVKTNFLQAIFKSATGFLQKLSINDGVDHTVELNFAKYGTTNGKDKSGAYLFLPGGQAEDIPDTDNKVIFVKGRLMNVVHVIFAQVQHTVKMCKIESFDCQSPEIHNVVDITQESNYELVMRLKSDIRNKDRSFYTDLNGFQVIKRKYFEKIPLQGNVYPMPSSAYIEDDQSRLTIVSAQPQGVGSGNVGWLEVFLDRRLNQDDNRGLFQDITDNKQTPSVFKIVLENMQSGKSDSDKKDGYHTLLAHLSLANILHPLLVLYDKIIFTPKEKLLSNMHFIQSQLPCDVNLVNLRTLSQPDDYNNGGYSNNNNNLHINESSERHNNKPNGYGLPRVKPRAEQAILLHRTAVDCKSMVKPVVTCSLNDEEISLIKLFEELNIESIEERTLSLMYKRQKQSNNDNSADGISSNINNVNLQPMDLRTFKIT